MPLDYEMLRIIWWLLLGILLIGFAITDGFDLGALILLPWLARTNLERRVVLNSIGPVWEGNQVWLILGAGALFAAWPTLYGLSFSGFYLAMLLALLGLILRPVSIKYRSKNESPRWRKAWDVALFISGFVPTLIFGVAIGNVIQGVPFYFDDHLRAFYTGSFLELLNPFALLSGLLSVFMLSMHGAFFLSVKTEGHLQRRSMNASKIFAILVVLCFMVCGNWLYSIDGYLLTSLLPHDGPSNPMLKTVIRQTGAWFNNYQQAPIILLVPLAGIFGPLLAIACSRWTKTAFLLSSIAVAGIIGTVGVCMFPFILPSLIRPEHSLLVWDSSSSELTLWIMLIVTTILLPIVLLYTVWVYRVLRGKVTLDSVLNHNSSY